MTWLGQIVARQNLAIGDQYSPDITDISLVSAEKHVGDTPGGHSLLSPAGSGRTQEEYTKRRKELTDSITNSRAIDETARQELLGQFSTTALDTISATFDSMVAGEGKYGARKRNQEHLLLAENRPGAVQLFGSNQGRTDAQNGLLSTQSGGLLTGGGFTHG